VFLWSWYFCVCFDWTCIPKVSGSIPTVVRQTFQPARCGYILRVTSETLCVGKF
jgi:hypothetical protein